MRRNLLTTLAIIIVCLPACTHNHISTPITATSDIKVVGTNGDIQIPEQIYFDNGNGQYENLSRMDETQINNTITNTKPPVKKDYAFAGWYWGTNKQTNGLDMTIPDADSYPFTDISQISNAGIKTAYIYPAWYPEDGENNISNGYGEASISDNNIDSDELLVKKDAKMYKVTFMINDTEWASYEVPEASTIPTPKPFYDAFGETDGWKLSDGTLLTDDMIVTNDMVITMNAEYDEPIKHTISFLINDKTAKTSSILDGANSTELPDFRDGIYEDVKWVTPEPYEISGNMIIFNNPVKKDITLKGNSLNYEGPDAFETPESRTVPAAIFRCSPNEQITFLLDGVNYAEVNADINGIINLPIGQCPSGREFEGWYAIGNNNPLPTDGSYIITDGDTIYGYTMQNNKWQAMPDGKAWTVTLMEETGTGARGCEYQDTITVMDGESLELYIDKLGNKKWHTGDDKEYDIKTPVKSNITLYTD